MTRLRALLTALVLAGLAVLLVWGLPRPRQALIVYTSVDSEYANPVARRFEELTGIPVLLRTDSEVSKTTGLLGRLAQMKERPDGDVFWNNELSGTLWLAGEGILEPYRSPQADSIPERFKSPDALWTGFGLRARVLIYNTRHVRSDEAPKSLEDLADPRWRGRFCVARPLFGTTRSHFVSLVLALGEDKGLALLRRLRENGSAGGAREWVVDGNAAVRDRVAEGYFHLGLTDTDDVYAAQDRKAPVEMVFIEQAAEWPGVYLTPNTVALVRGGPHPRAARRFVDFLLQPETEAWLARQGARQIPVRAEVPVPEGQPRLAALRAAAVDYAQLAAHLVPLSERIDRLIRGVDP